MGSSGYASAYSRWSYYLKDLLYVNLLGGDCGITCEVPGGECLATLSSMRMEMRASLKYTPTTSMLRLHLDTRRGWELFRFLGEDHLKRCLLAGF